MRPTWTNEELEFVRVPSERRAALQLFLLLLAGAVFATAVGLYVWWLWEYVINNPLPYSNPEARVPSPP